MVAAQLVLIAAVGACEGPFGLGTPTTRALEEGVARSLDSQALHITGTYRDRGETWSLDLQIDPSGARHIALSAGTQQLEATLIGNKAYFRGARFVSEHLGGDPLAGDLAKAVGSSWWLGAVNDVPQLPHLTSGPAFRSTFLGPAVAARVDHVSVDGADAVKMSGPRGDVFISAAPPHRLMRLTLAAGAVVDGLADADLRYVTDAHVEIAAPVAVVDLFDRATLPPMYSVVSVDSSRCARPCLAVATARNLGGRSAARAPSSVTFTASDPASGRTLASCTTPISSDVGHHETTTVSCTMDAFEPGRVSAVLTATADNPGAP